MDRGVPDHIRSDNGPEFTAKAVTAWLDRVEVKTLFIEPGSPWENGHVESFNGKFRDDFLNRELLDTLLEAKVLTARWRRHYNEERPHSSLRYRRPLRGRRERDCLLSPLRSVRRQSFSEESHTPLVARRLRWKGKWSRLAAHADGCLPLGRDTR